MKKINYVLILCITTLFLIGLNFIRDKTLNYKDLGEIEKEVIKESTFEEKAIPKIVDIIIVNNYYIALCEDGTVWSWDINQKVENIQKLSKLKDIVKIMEVGTEEVTIYALSKDGFVYAWGSNNGLLINTEENSDKIFYEPIRLKGLSDIIQIDANNGKAFALDQNGTFYAWGLSLYWNDAEDLKPGFPKEKKDLAEGVETLVAGAGEYSYFIREDKSVFSIMEADILDFRHIYPYIFPKFEIKGYETNKNLTNTLSLLENAISLSQGSKLGLTVLHELGTCKNIEKIGADGYTMFLYKEDNTLWYWNSDRILYHDNIAALANPETALINYSGSFEKIDFERVLGNEDSNGILKIVDICAGLENVLFLTNDGQVFMSEYKTNEIRDVEHYNTANTKKDRTDITSVISDMHLKELVFKKLDFQEIISINTDGNFCFSLVNVKGEYFYLDLTLSRKFPASIS